MSDPFDSLRARDMGDEPDLGAIKARARGIDRRRRVVQSAGAAAIVALALVGVFVRMNADDPGMDLAQPELRTSAPSPSLVAGAESGASRSGGAAGVSEPDAAEKAGGQGAAARGPVGVTAGSAASDASAAPLRATVEVEDLTQPHSVRFTLKVCNDSGSTVERDFGNAKRYDFEVSRDGKKVWRWSDGRSFAQVVGRERFEPGACRSWSEEWDGRDSRGMLAPTGSYRVVGELATPDGPRSKPTDFCLDIC
jgi:hypothetical protein